MSETSSTSPQHDVLPVCRECAEGKHVNCDGTAWDFNKDALGDCYCRGGCRHTMKKT